MEATKWIVIASDFRYEVNASSWQLNNANGTFNFFNEKGQLVAIFLKESVTYISLEGVVE